MDFLQYTKREGEETMCHLTFLKFKAGKLEASGPFF